MKLNIIQIISLAMPLWLPLSGSGAALGTRQRTITPVAVAPYTPFIYPADVAAYAIYGYSWWQWDAGTNEGRKFLTPSGDTGATNQARLLSFFSMSDIHITDKESPAQVPYMGWSAAFGDPGPGGLNPNSYSPVMFDTTYHLDAAVRTINALHRLTPFDFGISLGDDCNSSQYNELRWFIDVMDGQYITPSSGDHLGATNIDYQMPFQAAGLDHSIPWYDAIGNHDQYWMGIGYPTPKLQQAMVGTYVLNISTNNPLLPSASEGTGMYVGVVDGTTPFGTVIKWGLTNSYDTPPTVAADARRHTLTTDNSSPTNYVNEFFNTTSFPQGHGFNRANTGSLAACYTFLPLTNMPIKMIVLDDTCKSNALNQVPTFYGGGWVDAARYSWLTNELQMGQDADQLMILACHIPIWPQADLFDTTNTSAFYYNPTNETFSSVETNLIATLHNYPNLLLVMAGHRHVNVVTPQPSPDPAHPEYGFWEVETPSLRDFPRQFRTWEILRNSDNSISILTTSVDPVVETNSPAWKSIGYGVGAGRVFGTMGLTDTTSHTYNVELVKTLTLRMQEKIAGYGGPLGHNVAIDCIGTGVTINFLGELQSADTLLGPWSDVTDTSPYAVSATNGAKFYRACESDSSNSTPKATDYSKPEHWLTVPATNMPVDIFYLYPTSWTSTNSNPEVCAIDNPSMLQMAPQAFAKTATAFETIGNIYAPFYRQSNLTSNALVTEAGIPTTDAIAAFDYYIQHFNQGRPFILAGHSQGAYVLSKLLAQYMKAHPEAYARMIAAYVIGWPVTAQYLADNPYLKFAESADDTGVIISYNTQAPDVPPPVNPVLWRLVGTVINPLTWTRDETLATTNQGFGSFMPNTNGVYVRVPQYADARIDIANGVLICSTADKGTIGVQGIYHNFDYPFYYFNIRSNAANRVAKFLAAEQ